MSTTTTTTTATLSSKPTIKTYPLKPTAKIPNNPTKPLLHYPSFFTPPPSSPSRLNPSNINALFHQNAWKTQWIFRYGAPHPISHYHSRAHECMVVLSGEADILFGVADLTSPSPQHDEEKGAEKGAEAENELFGGVRQEAGGLLIHATVGDVFVIPAGVAHKAVDKDGDFALLTPGGGHGLLPTASSSDASSSSPPDPTSDLRAETEILDKISLGGFTMLGAYPTDPRYGQWDFMEGKEGEMVEWEDVWGVPVPERDPVLGEGGLRGFWSA